MAGSETAIPEGQLRISMRLNGWWYRKTGNEGSWERIMVPDTWRQAGAPHHRWYVRRFTLPSQFFGKRVILEFDAVRLYAAVVLNGQQVGTHAGGFTPFRLDVTDTVRPGAENTLVVYVKDDTYAKHGDRLYHQVGVTGIIRGQEDSAEGGIWQDVRLLGLPEVHVSDIHVRTSTRRDLLEASVTVRNDSNEASNVQMDLRLSEWPDDEPVQRQLPTIQGTLQPGEEREFDVQHTWPNPRLWSPEHPHLYWIQADLVSDRATGVKQDSMRARFGFREFWIDGPDFFLNGIRTRLRGDSDPARSAREPFMWRGDYVRRLMQIMKQEVGVNAFRIVATIAPPTVFDAADEIGILIIDQSSIWSLGKRWYRAGGERFMDHTRREFEAWIKRDRNHPSVVIWDAENEMLRNDSKDWDWVSRLPEFIRPFDDTRPIIHSGSGAFDPSMPVVHIHHHENYSALYRAYQARRDKPLLAGEYWVGGRSGERRLTSGEEFFSYDDYLRRSARLWKERMDEQRVIGMAGIMPYYWATGWGSQLLRRLPPLSSMHWPDPTAKWIKPQEPNPFLRPKEWNLPGPEYQLNQEVADAFRSGLSPVHVAFRENSGNYFSGEVLRKSIVVSNDLETGHDFFLTWQLWEGDQVIRQGERRRWMDAGNQWDFPLITPLPQTKQVRKFQLKALVRSWTQYQSHDELTLSLYPESVRAPPVPDREIGLYDPAGSLEPLIRLAPGRWSIVNDLETDRLPGMLVIGEQVDPSVLEKAGPILRTYVRNGGRLLLLQQTSAPDWLDAGLDLFQMPSLQSHNEFRGIEFEEDESGVYQSRQALVHSPAHPALQGIPDGMLSWWRAGDGRIADDVLVRPVSREQASILNMRSILGATRREYSSLLEVLDGDGLVLCSQAELMDNYQIDPAATRLLHNMLVYLQTWKPLQSRSAILAIGLGRPSLLDTWATSLDRLPPSLSSCRALLIGPEARLSDAQMNRVDQFVAEGGVAIYTHGATLPTHLSRRMEFVTPENPATILQVRRYSPTISGFNSYDCEYWTVPPANQVIRMRDEPETGGLLQASAVAHTRWGRGKQLDHANHQPLGLALVEVPSGKGSAIISQLPLPQSDNYQACAVYAAIFTNLGIQLPD